ncbi:uncharacterized protein K460DRAFT_354983 [Cucurbitaria berberidis CBS 394.84]|uniref:Uncharacterized protein n=1 Tax=Cucurbitaria berberidis CBS 394.84 TaxID=1168544 RepID=A0A9P4GFJ3_9PLEO|nr:uncharacterized protein K460DRAFT_354983 [Cucurbitaria berberidis CBS 394.84]KAF1845133.1 hypothetical protein K460DRAFT_354983 [Cucurbitaria berberidis CBS 394.84]
MGPSFRRLSSGVEARRTRPADLLLAYQCDKKTRALDLGGGCLGLPIGVDVGGVNAKLAYRTYRCTKFEADEDAVGPSHRDSGRRYMSDNPKSVYRELILSSGVLAGRNQGQGERRQARMPYELSSVCGERADAAPIQSRKFDPEMRVHVKWMLLLIQIRWLNCGAEREFHGLAIGV